METTHKTGPHKLYFAYGSNMNVEQMNVRCTGHELVGLGRLDGHRFRINSRSVATVVPEEGAVVHGLVWSISDKDEESLDVYEGVASGFYRKEQLHILLADGDKAEALVYVAADSSEGKFWGEYLNKIIKAAKLNKLPPKYIEELQGWTRLKRKYSQEEEEYIVRLMAGRTHGLARTRAEWHLNTAQSWTHEDYVEYTRFHLKTMDAPEEFYP